MLVGHSREATPPQGRCPEADRVAAPREHSRKPDEAYERTLCDGPYLEMFARFARAGWDRWGVEANSTEIGERRWRADGYPDAPQAAD